LSYASSFSTILTPDTNVTSSTPDSEWTAEHQDTTYKVVTVSEDGTRTITALETGYLGQLCEVQWLRGLKLRLQQRSPNEQTLALIDANYYLDNLGIHLLNQDNPFHLPDEQQATVLFQCYFRTVHTMFAFVPPEFQDQLQLYYRSMRSGQSVTFTQRWYAIVNLILAIGARFSRLINAGWSTDAQEQTTYISRAYQLLGLNNTALVLATPDLSLVQVLSCFVYIFMLLTSAGVCATVFLLHGHRPRKPVSIIYALIQSGYIHAREVLQYH
jgi:hypothetical protein